MYPEEVIHIILNESFNIHKAVGPGLLESIYKPCLAHRLRQRAIDVEYRKSCPGIFEEFKMECGYRADLVLAKTVVVELKSIELIADIHISQTLTYLRFLKLRYALS